MSRLYDLAEVYEDAGLDVLGHDAAVGRIDFEGSFEGQNGIGRSLGRLALEHGFAITSFARNNTAAPTPEPEFADTTTIWFDSIEVGTRTEMVEREVGVVRHECGEVTIE